MYTLDITPAEWELVYTSAFTDCIDEEKPRPAWAEALINSPIWGDGVSEMSVEDAAKLVEGFRKGLTDDEDGALAGLDTNTMLHYKLHQFWADYDLDRMAEKSG